MNEFFCKNDNRVPYWHSKPPATHRRHRGFSSVPALASALAVGPEQPFRCSPFEGSPSRRTNRNSHLRRRARHFRHPVRTLFCGGEAIDANASPRRGSDVQIEKSRVVNRQLSPHEKGPRGMRSAELSDCPIGARGGLVLKRQAEAPGEKFPPSCSSVAPLRIPRSEAQCSLPVRISWH